MPFSEEQLAKYFPGDDPAKYIEYFKQSILKYGEYEKDKINFSKDQYKQNRQAEKDERFYTTRLLELIHHL
jgi:hypothetical protein